MFFRVLFSKKRKTTGVYILYAHRSFRGQEQRRKASDSCAFMEMEPYGFCSRNNNSLLPRSRRGYKYDTHPRTNHWKAHCSGKWCGLIKQLRFCDVTTGFPGNNVLWWMDAEIRHWIDDVPLSHLGSWFWPIGSTTQSGVINMEFLHSLLRRRFAENQWPGVATCWQILQAIGNSNKALEDMQPNLVKRTLVYRSVLLTSNNQR